MPAHRIVGARQLDILIRFVQHNIDVTAVGNSRTSASSTAKKEVRRKWEEISVKLNGIGPTKKSAKMWRQYWADKKCTARRKFAMCQKDPNRIRLTNLDEQILGVLGVYSVDGKMFENFVGENTPSQQHARLITKPEKQQSCELQQLAPSLPGSPQPDPLDSTPAIPPEMEPVHYAEFISEAENNHSRSSRTDSSSPFNPPEWAIQLEMKQHELLQRLIDQSTRTNTLLEIMAGSLAAMSGNLHQVLERVSQIQSAVVKSPAEENR